MFCKICGIFINKNSNRQLYCKKCARLSHNGSVRKYRYGKCGQAYNLTVERYEEALRAQNNECLICGINFSILPSCAICIDHCHKTNAIRGILCKNCNIGLGLFKDNIISLQKAAEYLKKYVQIG